MLKVDFQWSNYPGQTILSAETDPLHLCGSRSAAGTQLLLPIMFSPSSTHRPILVQGLLVWGSEREGIALPLQGLSPNHALVIPVTDVQIALLEERRAGGEPIFGLRLQGVCQRVDDGVVSTMVSVVESIPFPLSRDRWIAVLGQCGFGTSRVVELPEPRYQVAGRWKRTSELLALASRRFASGQDGETIALVRSALEQIVEALGEKAAIPRGQKPFANYLEEVAKTLREQHVARSSDPFAVLSELVKVTFQWTSEPVHAGFDVAGRSEAAFALYLGTALYGLLAR